MDTISFNRGLVLLALLGAVASAWSGVAEEMAILPLEIELRGGGSSQRILLESRSLGRWTGPVTNEFQLSIADTNIARVEDSHVIAVADGQTTVTAVMGSSRISARLLVAEARSPRAVMFRNHVQPLLAKAGCSSGACHGAAAGQNGFKLSLRGYDDAGDYAALMRNAFGRRILPDNPGLSLLLLKPAGFVPHKGGKLIEPDSPEFMVLGDWIASGAPGPGPADARIERIELLPDAASLSPGMRQPLLVRAWFSDGHSEDVTRWAKFTSADASVATVDETGLARITGPGEGAVTAWFLSKLDTTRLVVPFPAAKTTVSKSDGEFKPRTFIDREVLAKLKELNLRPTARCSDGDFIRRVYLDLLGILPSAEETRAFLADRTSAKRDRLIGALLSRPEFNDYWAYKWSDLLLVQSRKLKPAAMWSFYRWIHAEVSANTPWDQFARKIVTAQGSNLELGAANFFVLHEDPRIMAETTSQAFLGMSINCARCHNHPMEKWTNDEYFGFANLFARVRSKAGVAEGEQIIFTSSQGDVFQPLTGKPQPPRPLESAALALNDPSDRRSHLAKWLVSPENSYFSRAIANRLWKHFFGVGLVEPVDDLRITNPASNEKLLEASAQFLVSSKFDLKSLMREMLRSETYQRTSSAPPENASDTRFYSRRYPRRLPAEVLLDAVSQTTGVPTDFPGYPKGWRALQLPDANVDSYFLRAFGRPERSNTCDCERSSEPNIAQVLHLANGSTLNQKLSHPSSRIAHCLERNATSKVILEDLYVSALSRLPSKQESAKMTALLESCGPDPASCRQAIEDIFWAVLSSNEFLFNH